MTSSQSDDHSENCSPANRRELRRAAFLDAAREVFVECGYEAASMSEIVRRAGGSLTTLYHLFTDKEGLFLAVLDSRVKIISADMQLQLASNSPIREGLTHIGEHFAFQTLTPDSIAVYRLIIGMTTRFPQIATRFQREGAGVLRQTLAEYLSARARAGEIVVDDALAQASLFLELARAGISSRVLVDPEFVPTDAEIKATVARGVAMFLSAYGTESRPRQ